MYFKHQSLVWVLDVDLYIFLKWSTVSHFRKFKLSLVRLLSVIFKFEFCDYIHFCHNFATNAWSHWAVLNWLCPFNKFVIQILTRLLKLSCLKCEDWCSKIENINCICLENCNYRKCFMKNINWSWEKKSQPWKQSFNRKHFVWKQHASFKSINTIHLFCPIYSSVSFIFRNWN